MHKGTLPCLFLITFCAYIRSSRVFWYGYSKYLFVSEPDDDIIIKQ